VFRADHQAIGKFVYPPHVPQCMARPRVARRTSKSDERESCVNVSGLLVEQIFAPNQHGYPRASRLTSGQTSKGRHGTQSLGCAFVHLFIPSRRLGGEAIDIDALSLCFQFDFDVGVIR
jgi:hypothetical protein